MPIHLDLQQYADKNTTLEPLPLVHGSKLSCLDAIIKDLSLKSVKKCTIFERDIIYMYYGGAFRRTKDNIDDPTASPIAFMFDPAILTKCYRVFPYDTGGALLHYENWGNQLRNWDDYIIAENVIPSENGDSNTCLENILRFICLIYESNSRYLNGSIRDEIYNEAPSPTLTKIVDFYKQMIASADRRKRAIECQFLGSVDLDMGLIWFAIPDDRGDVIEELYELNGDRDIEPFFYSSVSFFTLQETDQTIFEAADKFIKLKYKI